jgi:hypothetical protein
VKPPWQQPTVRLVQLFATYLEWSCNLAIDIKQTLNNQIRGNVSATRPVNLQID